VKIEIDKYATSFWDENEGKWCCEKGTYEVLVSTGGKDVVKGSFEVDSTRWWLGL